MWKIVPIDQNYEANENGDIRKIGSKQLVHQWLDKDDYKIVALTNRKLYRAHRIIALTFLDNPDNYPVVNHINHNKQDNRVENLEWTTYSQNSIHSYYDHNRDEGTQEWVQVVQPLAAQASKRAVMQLDQLDNIISIFSSHREASDATGICRSSISQCCAGKRKTAGGYKWKYLEGSTTKCEGNPTSTVRDSVETDEDIV